MPANWREVLELPGANSLKHLRALLESRPWWKLMPDLNNVVAVDGRGPFAANDCAITAIASDDATVAIQRNGDCPRSEPTSSESGAIATSAQSDGQRVTTAGDCPCSARRNAAGTSVQRAAAIDARSRFTHGDWLARSQRSPARTTVVVVRRLCRSDYGSALASGDGHSERSVQVAQLGLRAKHTRRPCQIRRWPDMIQRSLGHSFCRSRSIFSGSS